MLTARGAAQADASKQGEVLESVVGLLSASDDKPALHGEGGGAHRSHRGCADPRAHALRVRASLGPVRVRGGGGGMPPLTLDILVAALSKLSAAQMTELVREASNWAFQLDVQESEQAPPSPCVPSAVSLLRHARCCPPARQNAGGRQGVRPAET